MGLYGKKAVDRSVSSSRHSRDGRKASHRFSRAINDEISDQEVFKNELEAGILVGYKVGHSVRLLEARFISTCRYDCAPGYATARQI